MLCYVLLFNQLLILSTVGLAKGYGLDVQVSIPDGDNRFFFLFRSFQTDSESHPFSYPMGTRDEFLGDKAAGA
jgi:hypothetical protein